MKIPSKIKTETKVSEGDEKVGKFGEKSVNVEATKSRRSEALKEAQSQKETGISEIQETDLPQSEESNMQKASPNFGPFEYEDIVFTIKKDTNKTESQNLSSVNQTLRKLAGVPQEKLRIVLTVKELLDPDNEKVQFAKKENLKIRLQINGQNEQKGFIDSIENLDKKILDQIEVLDIIEIYSPFENKAMNIIEKLAEVSPNFTTLSCESSISGNFLFPANTSVTSFSCETIVYIPRRPEVNIAGENLETIKIGHMSGESELRLTGPFPKLKELQIGSIDSQISALILPELSEMPNLEKITFDPKKIANPKALAQLGRFQQALQEREMGKKS